MLKKIDKYIIRKFLTTFFFMLGVIMVLATVFDLAEKLSDFIKSSLTKRKKYHFLNFNRVPKLHRVLLYGFLKSHDIFQGKFISSLGGLLTNNPDEYLNWVDQSVPMEYEGKWKNFIKNYLRNAGNAVH